MFLGDAELLLSGCFSYFRGLNDLSFDFLDDETKEIKTMVYEALIKVEEDRK